MIGKEVAHYKILDRLGGGGMGVVYKAEDTRLGRIVALKFLNTELLSNQTVRKRFVHEARAASIIDHPNVCHVYEVGEDNGNIYMAMSYCEGRSLLEVIKGGPVPPREALSIAFGVAQGLSAAHRRGIVHRDIKPANVMLTDEGFVRIVDFGLALLIGETRVTTSGVTVGTVAYMSPEQTSNSEVAANTDIWSLGATLYELLTGQLPFRGDVNAAIVYAIVNEPHTALLELNGSVPPQCARIVDRCLEKDPTKRYQTIEALLEDMVSVGIELGWESSLARATIEPVLRERRRRILKRRIAVGASVAVIALGAVAAYRYWPGHSPYSTQVRLAVLPFDDLIGAGNEPLVDGLSDHVARVARWVSRGRSSMWTVLYSTVTDAQLAEPKEAADAFGVNRLIVGDVQRVSSSPRLRLRLTDAGSGRVIRETSLPLDVDHSTVLLDSLPLVLGSWFGVEAASLPRGAPWHARNAAAIRPYLEGLSYQRNSYKDAAMVGRAATTSELAVERDSTFAYALCAAGLAEMDRYRETQDPKWLDSALRHGRAARMQTPALTEASILLGNVFRARDLPDSAEAAFRFAAAVEPSNITARVKLGDLYAAQDRIQEAENSYREAVLRNPDYWISHRILGVFYFTQNREDDAATAWEEARKFAPHDVITLNNLGVVHYRHGNWSEAHDIFVQSFKLHPDCLSCNNIASTLFLDGKYSDAAAYFRMALSPEYCDSTGYLVWGNLASAMYWVKGGRPEAMTRYRHAIALAEKALVDQPDSPEVIAKLVDYYAMSGDSTRARAMIERARPYLDKNKEIMYRVGSAYEKLGQRSSAIHNLANAVRHGYALALITADPVLRDLINDPVFKEMTSTPAVADGAEATKRSD